MGLSVKETPRELAFCAHAILQNDIFEITNTLEDDRFCDHPLVLSDPKIRFYAGVPLIWNGSPLGTLCVIDHHAKKLSLEQKKALYLLTNYISQVITLRKNLMANIAQELQINKEKLELKALQLKLIRDVKTIRRKNAKIEI